MREGEVVALMGSVAVEGVEDRGLKGAVVGEMEEKGRGLWTMTTSVETKVEEIEIAPDEIAK